MGKNKLARFAENETFANLFQLTYEQITKEGFALKGKWNEDFFKNDNPIVLELGCGKGKYASCYPFPSPTLQLCSQESSCPNDETHQDESCNRYNDIR
mgnify:CR=1 FL=1